MDNDVVIKVRGGLGNQLFQYAFARSVQKQFPEKRIVLDASYFQSIHIRNLEINQINLDSRITWLKKRNRIFDFLYNLFLVFDRISHHRIRMRKTLTIGKNTFLFCDKFTEVDISNVSFCNLYLAGYFQQEKSLKDVRDELKNDIRPKKMSSQARKYLEQIVSLNSIGVSIRAGVDYHQFGWPVCSKNYYLEGLKRVYTPSKKIFVFADVIDKVESEKWFDGYDVVYIKGCSPVESLFLLSLCKDYVIANSTFSWWGAYLGDNAQKKVVCPSLFYPGIEMKNSDIAIQNALYLKNESGEVVSYE